MSEFIRIFEVVMPVLILVLFGYLGKKFKIFDDYFLDTGSRLVFKIFMPVNMFVNIYNATDLNVVNPLIIIYTVVGLTTMLLIGYLIYSKMGFDREVLAVMLQTLMRSNIVLFGLSIAKNYFDQDGVAIVAIYIGIISTFTNSTAVIIHELLSTKNTRMDYKAISFNIITNPIFIACILAILINGSGIRIYSPIISSLEDVAGIATPLGLMCVGGAIKFAKDKKDTKENLALNTTLIAKGLIVPVIFLTVFTFLGVTGPEMFF